MGVDMNIYHCSNPDENPLPTWLTEKKNSPAEPDFEKTENERVKKFKESPDSFFPPFYVPKKR